MDKIKNLKKKVVEKWKCPNNNLFIVALVSLIVFLLVEVGARAYNLYNSVPDIDIPTHLFAGIALFVGSLWIISMNNIKYKQMSALFFTFLGAVLWEIIETLEEIVIENPPYLRDVFFWDGFWDIIITVLGGIFGMFIIYLISKKTNVLYGIKI